jgi:hypothetical protein
MRCKDRGWACKNYKAGRPSQQDHGASAHAIQTASSRPKYTGLSSCNAQGTFVDAGKQRSLSWKKECAFLLFEQRVCNRRSSQCSTRDGVLAPYAVHFKFRCGLSIETRAMLFFVIVFCSMTRVSVAWMLMKM